MNFKYCEFFQKKILHSFQSWHPTFSPPLYDVLYHIFYESLWLPCQLPGDSRIYPAWYLQQKKSTKIFLKKHFPPWVFQFYLFCINFMLNSHSLLCLVSFWRWKGEDGELFQKLFFLPTCLVTPSFPLIGRKNQLKFSVEKASGWAKLPTNVGSLETAIQFSNWERKKTMAGIYSGLCVRMVVRVKKIWVKMPSDDIDNRIKT